MRSVRYGSISMRPSSFDFPGQRNVELFEARRYALTGRHPRESAGRPLSLRLFPRIAAELSLR